MRSKKLKCQDKERCKFSMIKTKKYKPREKTRVKSPEERQRESEERHAAAVLRIKADYDKVVDRQVLYEAFKSESPFVDDRNQVLTLVFCCTCELSRLCTGYCYVPRAMP